MQESFLTLRSCDNGYRAKRSKDGVGGGGGGKVPSFPHPHPAASSTFLPPSHLLELHGLNAKKLFCTVQVYLACTGTLLHIQAIFRA